MRYDAFTNFTKPMNLVIPFSLTANRYLLAAYERVEACCLAGFSGRDYLGSFLSLERRTLDNGTRSQKRAAARRIQGLIRFLAQYGEDFGSESRIAVDQLIEAANTWASTRLNLLHWAVLCGRAKDDGKHWRARYRVLSAAVHTIALATRRVRWLTALIRVASGFFGHDKSDLRNNP